MTVEEFQKEFGIIGRSKEIKDLVDITMQVAQSDITVLLYGESGTGKEVFARAIHGYSRRKDNNLISVNCGAIPEGILESELFGHKKGSFTGASETRKGYFEVADSGTLFLDEIGEMPLTTQVKLLRAIENKEFMRVGAETVTKVDVRFMAATNKDLQSEVDSKKFREDLYFRLKAVTLYIPPLRKRKSDIRELSNHFSVTFCRENNLPSAQFSEDAFFTLREYAWPGNIRELKNTIETAIALSRGADITSETLAPLLRKYEKIDNPFLPMTLGKPSEDVEREFIYRALFELKRDILDIKSLLLGQKGRDSEKMVYENSSPIEESLTIDEMEHRAILSAIKKAKGNKRKAALILDISERTLYRKLKEFGIEED